MRKTLRQALPQGKAAPAAYLIMCALVALYVCALFVLYARRPLPSFVFALLSALLFLLLLFAAAAVRAVHLPIAASPRPLSRGVFALSAAFCAAVMGFYLLAYYPGGISSDTISQWKQVQTRVLDDWHPALHTLLIWACTRVINHPFFVLLLQALCFSLAVGYAAAVLDRWGFPRTVVAGVSAYLSLNPAVCNVMTFLWKDCAFAIVVLVLAAQLLDIHFSRGAWLHSPVHAAALALTLCLSAILRHNGIALTLSVLVWLFISFPRCFVRLGCVSLAACALFAFIKGPVYRRAHVAPQAESLSEIAGAPMAVLSHVYAVSPDALDAETVAFLEALAPREIYQAHDAAGDWNAVKWHVNRQGFDGYSFTQIVRYAFHASLRAPQPALEALAGLWRMPLLPFGDAYWRLSPYVDLQNAYGFSQGGVPFFRRALNFLSRHTAEAPFSWAFWNPGFALLAVMLACALFAGRRPLSALLLPVLLIAYNLATALALSSSTDFRFFLFTPLVAPLCVLALIASPSLPDGGRVSRRASSGA
jgi:hypothetical protein